MSSTSLRANAAALTSGTGHERSAANDQARPRKHLRTAVFVSLLLVGGAAPARVVQGQLRQQPSLTASPNPVYAVSELGSTVITWSTGDGTPGEVYVAVDGGNEALFARSPEGSARAPWIQAGVQYEFRLYSMAGPRRLLASVQVTRPWWFVRRWVVAIPVLLVVFGWRAWRPLRRWRNDQRPADQRLRAGLGFGFGLVILAYAGLTASGSYRYLISTPEKGGDGPDYDSIAFSLVHGRGFAFDFESESFRAPYAAANTDGRYDYLLARRGGGDLTTYKPPLFPLILAGTYQVFGRQWVAIRLMNLAAMSVAIALLASIVVRLVGRWPAVLTVTIFAFIDHRLQWWATAVVTESLAALAVACVAWLLVGCTTDRRPARFVYAGAAAGAAILVRSIFVLWLPGLALVAGFIARPGNRVRTAALFLSAALVVPLPWFVRNSVVLDSLAPLGTQGDINLAAGYNDDALRRHGEWTVEWSNEAYGWMEKAGNATDAEIAAHGRSLFLTWVRSHLSEVPRLAAVKAVYSWKGYGGPPEWLMLLLSLGGYLVWVRRPEARVLLAVLAIHTSVIAATYWAGDQFVVPVRSIVAAGTALCLARGAQAWDTLCLRLIGGRAS